MLKIKQVGSFGIPAPALTEQDRTLIGGQAIGLMFHRVRDKHTGSDDAPMKPYSPKGPVYIPVTGRGRTKTSLKGREVLSSRDIRKMKGAGATVQRTRKSVKFANYAEYKKALGKSGQRDLELSGRMLGALTITRNTPEAVELGFTREEEHRKALGNEHHTPWFGLSPKNQASLTGLVKKIFDKILGAK